MPQSIGSICSISILTPHFATNSLFCALFYPSFAPPYLFLTKYFKNLTRQYWYQLYPACLAPRHMSPIKRSSSIPNPSSFHSLLPSLHTSPILSHQRKLPLLSLSPPLLPTSVWESIPTNQCTSHQLSDTSSLACHSYSCRFSPPLSSHPLALWRIIRPTCQPPPLLSPPPLF